MLGALSISHEAWSACHHLINENVSAIDNHRIVQVQDLTSAVQPQSEGAAAQLCSGSAERETAYTDVGQLCPQSHNMSTVKCV